MEMFTQIREVYEGRMGNNLTKTYLVFVDGEEAGYSKRKWLAEEIARAICDGRIQPHGDTTARLAEWAFNNDRPLFDRINKLPPNY